MANRSEPAFFHDSNTHALVESLATSPNLTIFAGAGISKDRGSPVWEELVIQLLNAQLLALPDDRVQARVSLDAARSFTTAVSPVVAASAVRQLYEERNPQLDDRSLTAVIAQDIHKHLYGVNRWAPGGSLAESIVRLAVIWKSLSLDVAILTTNYDSNIEDFAGDDEARQIAKDKGIKLEAFVDAKRASSQSLLPVYHLHGYIPFKGRLRGNLAFSESGLALGKEVIGKTATLGVDWRSEVLEERLNNSTTIFVGTSLRDRAVADSLIRTRSPKSNRYALFPYQGDEWANLDRSARSAANLAWAKRLQHLQVIPIRPDFYGQVAQLLNEIVHCRLNCSSRYVGASAASQRYGGRLEEWWRQWRRVTTKDVQNRLHDRCQEVLSEARETAMSVLKPARGEILKVEIWVRHEPAKHRELYLWSSSEAATRSGQAAHRAKIENNSSYVAVRAFCQGYAVRGALTSNSRWKSYFSVPVLLSGSPWHGLPVGVVNLISTADDSRTCLRSLGEPGSWSELFACLRDAGIRLLDPASSDLASM